MQYRFIIVDDEYYVRQRVKRCIDWQAHGFVCMGEMESAAHALRFLAANTVELIITDISMPEESGLSLIETIRRSYSQIRFIVLSGFSTFEYAKEAFRYGVVNYLLKPVNTEELIKTLQQVKAGLDAEIADRKQQLEYQSVRAMHEMDHKKRVFLSLLEGIPDEEGLEYLRNAGIKEHTHCAVVVMDIMQGHFDGQGYGQKQSMRFRLQTFAEEYFLEPPCLIACPDMQGRIVLLLQTDANELAMNALLAAYANAFQGCTRLWITTGYSTGCLGTVASISEGYRRGLSFFMLRTLYGNDVDVMSIKLPGRQQFEALMKQGEIMRAALNINNEAKVTETLHVMFAQMRAEHFSVQALETVLNNLLIMGINYALNHSLQTVQLDSDWASYSCSEILRAGITFEEICDKFEQMFIGMVDAVNTPDNHSYIEKLVLQAAEIIRGNYQLYEMGLNYVASMLLISPAYLSRSFKRITGETLTQYMTKLRVENAKALLESTDLSIGQIGEEVGYRDAFYFSKQFKRHYSIAPSEYRIQHRPYLEADKVDHPLARIQDNTRLL